MPLHCHCRAVVYASPCTQQAQTLAPFIAHHVEDFDPSTHHSAGKEELTDPSQHVAVVVLVVTGSGSWRLSR